jgi:hypothetical protein
MKIKKQKRTESCISRVKLFKAKYIDGLTTSAMARLFHTQNYQLERLAKHWGIDNVAPGSDMFNELEQMCNKSC